MTLKQKTPLILIIDDDQTTCFMLQGILHESGFRTESAGNAASGLAQVNGSQPDLILLDINLPDEDGFSLCRRLLSTPSTAQTPILFISSNEDVSAKVKAFELGGVDYITKPLSGREIIARVRTHLRLKQAYDQLAELQAERIQKLADAQKTLLPRPENFPEARFHVAFRPVYEAGGDFYDVIRQSEQITDYIVADASGHDLDASFWTAAMKALLQEYATPVNTPVNALQGINNALCRIMPSGSFFTAIYARLNRQSGRLVLVNGGHPPALVLEKGRPAEFIPQTGDVIGAFVDAGYGQIERILRPDTRLFLYSDGLVEIAGDLDSGCRVLSQSCDRQMAESLEGQVNGMVQEMLQYSENPADDILLMGIEI